MNYEEKYNDLLSRIKRMADVQPDVTKAAIESLFPELKESEGEEIRKEIIAILKYKYEKFPKAPRYSNVPKWIDWLEKQGEQKPAWSEEDNAMFNFIALILRNHQSDEDFTTFETTFKDCIDWFKSLKDRVQSQNKWKESLATADLENSLCDIQDGFSDTSYEYRILGEAIEFIRCTEPKPQWKPSDDEMKALTEALSLANNCGEEYAFDLRTLYKQLKKLREE